MKLYRVQLGKWRLAEKRGIEVLDTTVKSGVSKLSPSWEMVNQYKSSKKTVDDIAVYCVQYLDKLNSLWRVNPEVFMEVAEKGEIAIACMCPQEDGRFCHLEVLVECFEKVCKAKKIPFEYKGYIK